MKVSWPHVRDYQNTYDNVTNKDAGYDELISFIESLNGLEGTELESFFESSFSNDAFLSYLTAGTFCADIDRVWHNHFLYHNKQSGVWELIPANLSRTFEQTDASILLDVEGESTVNGPWPLVTQFLSISNHLAGLLQTSGRIA